MVPPAGELRYPDRSATMVPMATAQVSDAAPGVTIEDILCRSLDRDLNLEVRHHNRIIASEIIRQAFIEFGGDARTFKMLKQMATGRNTEMLKTAARIRRTSRTVPPELRDGAIRRMYRRAPLQLVLPSADPLD